MKAVEPMTLSELLDAAEGAIRDARLAGDDEHESQLRGAVGRLHLFATVAENLVQTW